MMLLEREKEVQIAPFGRKQLFSPILFEVEMGFNDKVLLGGRDVFFLASDRSKAGLSRHSPGQFGSSPCKALILKSI